MVGFALDTNAAIAVMKFDQSIRRLLSKGDVFISMIALGELYYGAYNSQRLAENMSDINRLIRNIEILPINIATTQYYGQIRAQLKQIGRPIPVNDIWIEACAMQFDLELVTRDGHFKHVSGLKTVTW